MPRPHFFDFDPDQLELPALALRVEVEESVGELPMHQHAKGQLVLALRGAVTSEVPDGYWMVPPQCAVWIPAGVPHSNRMSANASIYFLFVAPGVVAMPAECCTLAISPMVREMILHLAALPQDYAPDGPTGRLAMVLLEELGKMPTEQLYLPISGDARMRRIAKALMADPSDRSTVAEWGARMAMSERTLARCVLKETGLTFGRWRQQLLLIVALQRLSLGASVQAVAEELGYESVSAFITMFKASLGKPPGRYFADKESKRGRLAYVGRDTASESTGFY